MPEESDWIIHGPFSDKTLMRNVLMYGWSNAIGHYTSRTRFIELFYKSKGGPISMDDYLGVYVLMEKIKRSENRVDIEKLRQNGSQEPEVKGGYILERDRYDESQSQTYFRTDHYGDALNYYYPAVEDITNAQRNWIKGYMDDFEAALSGPDYTDIHKGYAAYIDVMSFIDHHILNEIARNVDGFTLSTYMFKKRGGKLTMGPIWDFNGSLGNGDYRGAWKTSGWLHMESEFPADNENAYHSYSRLFEDEQFRLQYEERWKSLRNGPLATDKMRSDIDKYAELLSEAAERNFERWDILGEYVWPNDKDCTNRNSFQDEVEYLKDWLTQRLEWIDGAVPPTSQFGEE